MTYPVSLVNILTVIAATGLVGAVAGVIRGRSIGVQTDQIWGVARPQPALGGAVIAIGVVAAALVDAVAGFLPQGTLPRQAYVAAASSLLAGYLAGRALEHRHTRRPLAARRPGAP